MVHPNFKSWFSRNPEISVEADMILFGTYWVLFFYGLLLSCSIYFYTFKRENLESTFISKVGLFVLLASIFYAVRSLVFQGNLYIPLFPIVILWGFWVTVFSHPDSHPEFPKFPSKTVDNNICMDSQTFYNYYGPYGPFGYPYQLKDTGGENGKIFDHNRLTLWYRFVKDLISMKSIFGTHTYNAMKAFQEFNAGADCPQGNETCRELNLLLQSMMKEYAPRPVDSSQISIAEMNTPERLKPAHDQNDQPLPTNQGQGAEGQEAEQANQGAADGPSQGATDGPSQGAADGPSQGAADGPSQGAAGQPANQGAAGQPANQGAADGPSQGAAGQQDAALGGPPASDKPPTTGGYLYNEPIGSVPGTLQRQY